MSTCVHPQYSTPGFPDNPKAPAGPSPQQQTEQWIRHLEHLSVKLKQQVKDDDGGPKTKRKADVWAPPYDDADGEPGTKQKKLKKSTPPPAHTHVPGGGKPETCHRPVEIGLPVAPAQWQAFAQCRFVDLDRLRAGLFQVEHFVADSERDLPARRVARRKW